MPITTSTKRLPTEEQGMEDRFGGRSYAVALEIDQTDNGAMAAGAAVVIAAQNAGQCPLKGATYAFDQGIGGPFNDLDSYLQEITWQRVYSVDAPRRWRVDLKYAPAENSDPDQLGEGDPLLWPVEYWIEWVEEQIPLGEAKNVEALPQIFRPANTLGPIVNAAGQEFTEPQMRTVLYPVLNCQKAYGTLNEIVALNLSFQETTNNNTFFGAAARTAKYLSTESGRVQRVQGQSFYMGVTRIWFKDVTWDRKVLNNGFNMLVKHDFGGGTGTKYIGLDGGPAEGDGNPLNGIPDAFRMTVKGARRASDPMADDDEVPSSEPFNLNLDGTKRQDTVGTYITYRYLDEVNYAGIGIGGGP